MYCLCHCSDFAVLCVVYVVLDVIVGSFFLCSRKCTNIWTSQANYEFNISVCAISGNLQQIWICSVLVQF